MKSRRRQAGERVFAVIGDLGEGAELALHEVLTWPTLDHLRRFCDPMRTQRSAWDMVTKDVQLGERGGSVASGMTLPVASSADEADGWTVKLGNDRPLRALCEGETVTLLASVYRGGDGAGIWTVSACPAGTITVVSDGVRLAGVPGVAVS